MNFPQKNPVLTQQKVESQALASTINGSYHNWQHTIPIVPAITGSSIIPSMVVEFGKTSTEARTGCGRTPWGSCEIALVTSTCRDGKKNGEIFGKTNMGILFAPIGDIMGLQWDVTTIIGYQQCGYFAGYKKGYDIWTCLTMRYIPKMRTCYFYGHYDYLWFTSGLSSEKPNSSPRQTAMFFCLVSDFPWGESRRIEENVYAYINTM